MARGGGRVGVPVEASPDCHAHTHCGWVTLCIEQLGAALFGSGCCMVCFAMAASTTVWCSARLYVGELWTSRVPPCDKWLIVDSVNHEPPAEVNFTFTFDARHTRACWPARNLVTSVTCILCCCRPRPQCDCWRKTPSWRRLALHVRVLGWRYLQT